MQRGCAGFVIDGAIRDVSAFADTPCYARGVVHCGPYKTGPGEINVPVSIGGMIVSPGDLVVGDEDGLVAFPQTVADEVIEAAARHADHEAAVMAEIASGNPRQSWIEAPLKKFGLLEDAL